MAGKMVLSPAALTWLGSAFTEKTKISPLATIQEPGFTAAEKAALADQGVIDGGGAFTSESFAVFETLAGVTSYAGFRLTGAFGRIVKTVYFKDGKSVAIDSTGHGLVVSVGVDVDTLAGLINEITGISRLVNAQVNVKMGVKSALAFAALLDVTRKHALIQYAGLGEMPTGYSAEQIIEMHSKAEGSRWLTSYLRTLRLPQMSLNGDELEKALHASIEVNLLEKSEQGYRLIGEAYDLATNFLIIENVLHARLGEERDGEIVSGEALFLQAGLHDVLMIDVDAETVEFNTVSTQTLVEYVQTMMVKAPAFR